MSKYTEAVEGLGTSKSGSSTFGFGYRKIHQTRTAIADIDSYAHNGHVDAILEPVISSDNALGNIHFSSIINGSNNHKYVIIQLFVIRSSIRGTYVDIPSLELALASVAEWASLGNVRIAYEKLIKHILGNFDWSHYANIYSDRLKWCKHVLVFRSREEFEAATQYFEYPRVYHAAKASGTIKNESIEATIFTSERETEQQRSSIIGPGCCPEARKKLKECYLRTKGIILKFKKYVGEKVRKCFKRRGVEERLTLWETQNQRVLEWLRNIPFTPEQRTEIEGEEIPNNTPQGNDDNSHTFLELGSSEEDIENQKGKTIIAHDSTNKNELEEIIIDNTDQKKPEVSIGTPSREKRYGGRWKLNLSDAANEFDE